MYAVSLTLSITFDKLIGVGLNESFEGEIKRWYIEDKLKKE